MSKTLYVQLMVQDWVVLKRSEVSPHPREVTLNRCRWVCLSWRQTGFEPEQPGMGID